MQTWRVGEVTITSVVESVAKIPAGFLYPQATPEAVAAIGWLKPDFVDEAGLLVLAIQALVVRTPQWLIVVDTCVGDGREGRSIPSWNSQKTSFLEDFAAAGFDRTAVDFVLCTHLHADHVGWNTMRQDGAWVPTFPKARYLIAASEFAHWKARTSDTEVSSVFADSIEPILRAGLFTTVETDHRICNEVSFVSTPGHTPGHVSVQIESQEKRALITGDFIHHPVQMVHPEWMEVADGDGAQSERTRRAMLAEYADRPILVIGTHFPAPAGGKVVRDGGAYRFKT